MQYLNRINREIFQSFFNINLENVQSVKIESILKSKESKKASNIKNKKLSFTTLSHHKL